MSTGSRSQHNRFFWFDLATTDAANAAAFYRGLFGWAPNVRAVSGGRIGQFMQADTVVASFYPLSRRHLEDGVPSHWTPYVAVPDVNRAARRAAELGGTVIVEPFDVPGIAEIALVQDATGALLGLGRPIERE